jgi:hypothetical protein
MGSGGAEMDGTTGPVDQGEDDHTEFIREPHTEMGEALTSSDVAGVVYRVLSTDAGVYSGSHRE